MHLCTSKSKPGLMASHRFHHPDQHLLIERLGQWDWSDHTVAAGPRPAAAADAGLCLASRLRHA